jgi:thioester reductase-like protein
MTRSILQRFRDWVASDPDQLLYAFLDFDGNVRERYTYAQFLQRTADIAAHILRVRPLAAGERVLLAYPPGVEMICAFFACVRLGLLPVPVYAPAGRGFEAALQKMEFIARDCGAAAVLTTRSFYWSMKLNETRTRASMLSFARSSVSRLPWIVSTDADAGTGAAIPDAHSDILFLQYTSGSTTAPRGVIVTHENILANCDAVVDHRPIGVSWLPQYHDMGLIGYYLFFALKGGTTYGFSPLDFTRRPALWLETITKYRGSASSAPNFAYEYCLRPDRIPASVLERLDLSSLRFLMTAAEPVRGQVCRDFIAKFKPYGLDPKAFFAAYGLAEFTLAVSNYGRKIERFDRSALRRLVVRPAPAHVADRDTTTLVSCGRALGATEIRIVDVRGEPKAVLDGEVGEIWVRGPSKCAGYWRRPELSAEIFEARLDGETGGRTWLRTGDLGFLHDDELYICGRLKDTIIVRGLNYYPQDIEAIVEKEPHIRKGCVAAFSHDRGDTEALVIVAEVRDKRHMPDARTLNQRLFEGLGITAATIAFIDARTIPKTSSGKIARHLVRQQWLDDELAVVASTTLAVEQGDGPAGSDDGARAWLRPFGITGDESWTLADAGFDSLRVVEFAEALRRQLERAGNHDLSGEVDMRVLQRIAICELMELVDQVVASAPHGRLRLKRALSDLGREHRALEAEAMRRDAQLRFDVPSIPRDRQFEAGGILLTGATGFFGPFLLASLLKQQPHDIHVLVRSEGDAMQRIRVGLESISSDDSAPEGWERRVWPVRGDLAAPGLGLDHDTWRALARSVDTIYHNGAVVNYLLDYAAMRDANVGGTNEVIRLAMSERAKVLNYISTTFIFGWSVQETLHESDTNSGMERLDFGYSQSKWVAEQVVRDAARQGLQARIFRPALLTPSLHGGGSNFDIAIRLLSFMIRHGLTTTARNQVSFTPADIAAGNIVAISRMPEGVGRAFHVTRDDYACMTEITSILGELMGRSFREYSLADFVPEVIQRCHPGDVLFPLLDFLVRSVDNISAMEFKRYDNANYRRFRDAAGGRADPPLRDVVHGMLRFMRRRGLVETEQQLRRASRAQPGARG